MTNHISKADVLDTFMRWKEVVQPFELDALCNVIKIDNLSPSEILTANDNIISLVNGILFQIEYADKADPMIAGLKNFSDSLIEITKQCDKPISSVNQALIIYVIEQHGKRLTVPVTEMAHEVNELKIINNLSTFAVVGKFGDTLDRFFNLIKKINFNSINNNTTISKALLTEANISMVI